MCIPLVKDPNNVPYAVAFIATGLLQDSTISSGLGISPPASVPLNQGSNTWLLSTDTQGRLVITSTTFSSTAPSNYTGVDSTGAAWALTIDSTGNFETAPGVAPIRDTVPMPNDTTFSTWPLAAGVICNTCANASVTVAGNMGCWCCTCNAFVNPDDTSILVALDE